MAEGQPDEGQGQMIPIYEPPQDLHELYMRTRAEISTVQSFSAYYMKLMLLIDIGKEMLLDRDEKLKEEASRALSDGKNYPEPRQMERDSDGYRMGPGSGSTGLIHIHGNDLPFAVEEVKNQQATALIPTLKELDNKIFRTLVRTGLVEIKRPPSIEETLVDSIMMDIRRRALEKRSEVENVNDDG